MIANRQSLIGLAVFLGLAGCRPSVIRSTAEQTVDGLNLDQIAGQLMMVGFRGPDLSPEIRKTLGELHPGGVCLYAHNITGAEQVGKLNDQLRTCLDEALPPFLAIDQEGGVVVRIYDGVTVFPSSMALGATRSPELAMETGRTIGRELRLLGFNMNLAPVLDTPDNLAIGSRAFGDDTRLIAALGSALICGQQEAGVATVAKHFPGEGHSYGDSHYQLPVRWDSAATIRAEMDPFCEAIRHDLDAVMTAHVAVPALARNRSPATISSKLLTGVLRQELSFDGLVLTDELEGMRAVSAYGVDQVAVAAIKAGADMVFVSSSPETQKKVHRELIRAIQSGRIPKPRLEQALSHIMVLKAKRKLFDPVPPLEERLAILHRKDGQSVAREIAQRSMTRLGPDPTCLPIKADSRIALVTDSQNLAQVIQRHAPQTRVLLIDSKSLQDWRSTKRSIRELDATADVVIGAFILQQRFEILRDAVNPSHPLVILFMNVPGPDFLRAIPQAQAVLVNYCYQPVSAEAAAAVLFDNAATKGILPVKLESEVPATKAASAH